MPETDVKIQERLERFKGYAKKDGTELFMDYLFALNSGDFDTLGEVLNFVSELASTEVAKMFDEYLTIHGQILAALERKQALQISAPRLFECMPEPCQFITPKKWK
jgi:hypothetical protein